jgi:hypothetical protein
VPRTRKDETPILLDEPQVEGRYAELADTTVGFETFHLDADPTPLFRGLPDDRCPCPHWGVVLSGRIVVRYRDREEVLRAGDAYLMTPGHLTEVAAGTEVVEFSPTDPWRTTMAVMGANLAAQEAAR